MLRLMLLLAVILNPPSTDPFTALAVYNGTWSIHAQHSFSGGAGPDTLINRCTRGEAFYTCEQILNGKSAALIIFTLSKEPGKFDVDSVTPNGHAASDTDLFIRSPEHWTFITNSANGKPHFRVENTFHGSDAIHFEQFVSADDGQTWTKANEGDESRLRP